MSKKVSVLQRKSRRAGIRHLYKVENLFRSNSAVNKLPRASTKGCVLVPFALTACIPESAIRKYAAKEPFTVHVDDGISKILVMYLGDSHK